MAKWEENRHPESLKPKNWSGGPHRGPLWGCVLLAVTLGGREAAARHKLVRLTGLSGGQPASYLWSLVSCLNWFLFHDDTVRGPHGAPGLGPVLSTG